MATYEISCYPPGASVLMSKLFHDGDAVNEGDVIAHMEVMKMQIDVIAERSGVITYEAAEGEYLSEENVLAVIRWEE